MALLPLRLAISHRVLPLMLEQQRLIVAVDRPGRVLKLRELDAYAQHGDRAGAGAEVADPGGAEPAVGRRLEPQRVGAAFSDTSSRTTPDTPPTCVSSAGAPNRGHRDAPAPWTALQVARA